MSEDNLPRRKPDSAKMTEEDEKDEIGLAREIRIDEEPPGFSSNDEIRDLRRDSEIQRLGHRMNLLFILVPCLICALLVFSYLDLNDKLGKMKRSGSIDLQALSQEIIGNVASLSEEFKALAGRLSALEKTSVSMKQAIQKDERAIQKVTVSKIGKEALEKALKKHSSKVADTVATLRKDLGKQKKSVDGLAKNLERQSAEYIKTLTALGNELREQKKSVENLNGVLAGVVQVVDTIQEEGQSKVDKEELETFLKKDRAIYQTRMAILEKQIKTLEEEVSRLKGQATPVPDNIIEQEIMDTSEDRLSPGG